MRASMSGHAEIVKILLEQEGIEINAIDISLLLSMFISINLYFKVMFGNSSNCTNQHLSSHLKKVILKLSIYFICKKKKIS